MWLPDTCKGTGIPVTVFYIIIGATFQTLMLYSTYTACRDPEYVEDPTSFKPERWVRDSPTNEVLEAILSAIWVWSTQLLW